MEEKVLGYVSAAGKADTQERKKCLSTCRKSERKVSRTRSGRKSAGVRVSSQVRRHVVERKLSEYVSAIGKKSKPDT